MDQQQMNPRLQAIVLTGLLAGLSVFVSGCASSMAGYEAQNRPACSSTNDGMPCTNMTDIYKASSTGRIPTQQPKPGADQVGSNDAPVWGATAPANANRAILQSGVPVRTPPRVLRALIFPWEDANGVVSDQKLIYITLDSGRWMLDQNQQNLVDEFAPTRLRQSANSRTNGQGTAARSGAALAQPGNVFVPNPVSPSEQSPQLPPRKP